MDSTTDDIAAWLALLRAPGVGSQTINRLLAAGRSPRQLLEHPPADLPTTLRDYLHAPDWPGVYCID